jgi:competence protein ComEA
VRVNLAQRVHDEQQIYVPRKAEDATPVLPTTPARSPATGGSSPSTSKININTASATELQQLPGIGPVLASRIIEYREAHGPFRKPEDIKRVSGIGDATFERMADLIALD